MRQRSSPTFFATEVTGARRFYHNLAAASEGALKVVTGGVEHCGANYCVDRTSFPFLTIEYVSRGKGELEMEGRSLALGPGNIFAYDKGMPHRITSGTRGHLVKYFVAFTGIGSARLLKDSGLTGGQLGQISPVDALTALFEELIWAGTRSSRDSEAYCGRILHCLAVRIKACLIPSVEYQPTSFEKYQNCRDFIERSFLTLHTAQDIAKSCQISEAHLCHLFQRYDHQAPYRMLTRLKMNHAAMLLQQPGILVRDAAEATGYSDPFHFSRVFRNTLGVPPSVWRRMNASKAVAI